MTKENSLKLDVLKDIRIEQYSYELPERRIAKYPLAKRSDSKLLVYRKGVIETRGFNEVTKLLSEDDLLVFNNTKVIHARLFFQKVTGAVIEIFCLEPHLPEDYAVNFLSYGKCEWKCMVGNLKKWKEGEIFCDFVFKNKKFTLAANKKAMGGETIVVEFKWDAPLSFSEILECCGKMPIPPYLNRESEQDDEIRYQTVYSKNEGSVAAPTAGLHFDKEIIRMLKDIGVTICELTLHVGAGTFRPVKSETIGQHDMHTEHIIISKNIIENLLSGKKITAVGTTSVRTLESIYWMGVKLLENKTCFYALNQWEAYELPQHYTLSQALSAVLGYLNNNDLDFLKAETTIIIVPGYKFRVIKAMFTNFHQPQSTLLLLVAAAVGRDWKNIYDYAMENDYRFLSYGDSSYLQIKQENLKNE